MKQLIETIESFQERGIGLKSLQDPIDTSSPSGKLVFHIFAALAEFERGVIRERTTAGLRAARERGRVGGRPSALSAKDLQAVRRSLRTPISPLLPSPAAEGGRIYVILPYSPCEKCESRDRLGREYNDSGIMNRLGKPQSGFRRMWILLPCLL